MTQPHAHQWVLEDAIDGKHTAKGLCRVCGAWRTFSGGMPELSDWAQDNQLVYARTRAQQTFNIAAWRREHEQA